jgi:thioredoxin 1
MQQASDDGPWQVICLCAAWCGVCRDWDAIFRALAPDHPGVRFAWVDVEDDDDAMGDIDIETFPTLLVAEGRSVRFLGPVPPTAAHVRQLLARLRTQAPAQAAAPAADALLARLQPLLPARGV